MAATAGWIRYDTTRYDNKIFIVRSKADSNQLNLSDCTIAQLKKVMTRNSKIKSQKYRSKLRKEKKMA